jgi:hypothetical protein
MYLQDCKHLGITGQLLRSKKMNQPFVPIATGGKTLACTATTGRVALPAAGDTLRICNVTTDQPAFIELGLVTVEAVKVTGMCIPPSSQVVVGRNISSQTYLAGVCNAGAAATLYINAGYGGL